MQRRKRGRAEIVVRDRNLGLDARMDRSDVVVTKKDVVQLLSRTAGRAS